MRKNSWSAEEDAVLKQYYSNILDTKLLMAYLPNRTMDSIKSRAYVIGLRKNKYVRKVWTEFEIKRLKALYANRDNIYLCRYFKCSFSQLYNVAHRLKLKKSKEYLSQKFGAVLIEVGKNTRYNKGSVPANKGKKWDEYLSIEQQDKIKQTSFKKGHKPHNIVPVGYERITKDGYVEVKVSNNEDSTENFKLKHRLVWESIHGPIPDNHQIRFIDGNKLNFDINNLKLVSLSESLVINSMSDSSIVKRFLGVKDECLVEKIITDHNEIVSLKRNTIILNQKINEHAGKTKII